MTNVETELTSNTHKLSRLTLIGWYLFEAEDIDLKFQATLFKGLNGSGKSSILDAIQTIMAGGDENKIRLNGASTDSRFKSGRSLRDYCLGAIDEGNARKASNSYLALTFERPDGSEYAMGVSMYATELSGQKFSKRTFFFPNCGVSKKDFFIGEDEVATWEQFKRSNMAINRNVVYPSSSREFRDLYCQSMSPSNRFRMSSDMVFSSISKGLALKQETDFTSFCRTQILPEEKIDVDRIEGTFVDFKKIKQQIELAEQKKDYLDGIIKYFEVAIKRAKESIGYRWAKSEAQHILSANLLSELSEKQEDLNEHLKEGKATLKHLDTEIPRLEGEYENARDAYKHSEGAIKRDALKNEQDQLNKSTRVHEQSERHMISQFKKLVSVNFPENLEQHVQVALDQALGNLANTLGLTRENDLELVNDASWCDDSQRIEVVNNALLAMEPAFDLLKKHYDQLVVELDNAEKNHRDIEDQLNKARTGLATYSPATQMLIERLAENGIEAKPVGGLVSITDTNWQAAIEGFLGGNRESLVIFDSHGEPTKDRVIIERAINIYRSLKKSKYELGKAKIIKNTLDPKPTNSFSSNIAASLIESDNFVALNYMQSQLGKVELVETDAELRLSERAVARDGTISANGVISGGNRVNQWLIGVEAIKRNAKILEAQHNEASMVVNRTSILKGGVDKLSSNISKLATDVRAMIEPCALGRKDYLKNRDKLNRINKALNELTANNEVERMLEEAVGKLKIALSQAKEQKDVAIKFEASTETELNRLNKDIISAEAALKDAEQKRLEVETEKDFDSSFASELFTQIEEKLGENSYGKECDYYRDLCNLAETKSVERQKWADSSEKSGHEKLTEYWTKYDVMDKAEFHDKDIHWRITRCTEHLNQIIDNDIIKYKFEAESYLEELIKTFRSEVISTLRDNFDKLEGTFHDLNQSLKDITFNGYRYKFVSKPVESETLKVVHDYAMNTNVTELEAAPDSLFATSEDHPAIRIIESILEEERLEEIQDYRNFYTFDLLAKRVEGEVIHDDKWRNWDDIVGVGSGGEKGTPMYIALGASYMAAFKVRVINGVPQGGAAFAVFDEAFGKIDGNNTTSALLFLKQIGLQVILAAPPEDKMKMSQGLDRTYSVVRSGNRVELDYEEYSDEGKALYLSDNPYFNRDIIVAKMLEMESKRVTIKHELQEV